MLNALGQAADPEGFRSVVDESQLREVSPKDLLKDRCAGYQTLFPQVRELWEGNREVISLIMENHDVAKHRSQTSQAGSLELKSLPDLGESPTPEELAFFTAQIMSAPMKQVLLPRSPKLPTVDQSDDLKDRCTLEDLESEWELLIARSFRLAEEDARAGIPVIEPA